MIDLKLACFGILTQEEHDQFVSWMLEDRCFAQSIIRFVTSEDPEFILPERDVQALNAHEEACGRCWQNLLITSQNGEDPFKRKIYLNVHCFGLWSLMRHYGGKFDMEELPGYTRFVMSYPDFVDAPYSGGEVLFSRVAGQASRMILDVRTQQLYDHPDSVRHYFDRILAQEVKDYDRPGGEPIQWWSILEEGDCSLCVRWEGQVKEIEVEWRLQPRYHHLMRPQLQAPDISSDSPDRDTAALEALKLRELILKYNGKSRLAGYLKRTASYRRIDTHRKSLQDAQNRSVEDTSVAVPPGASELSPEDVLLQEEFLTHAGRELDATDWRILDLSADGKTDEEIGKVVGLRRETVNGRRRKAESLLRRLAE